MPPQRVWELVSDPHHMPRWWPLAARVEDVRSDDGLSWTVVLTTDRGTTVRADFERSEEREGTLLRWEQAVEGTPFGRILKSATTEIAISPDGGGSRVALTSDERLRGLSRLGRSMVRNAARKRLDEALDGIERALVADGGA